MYKQKKLYLSERKTQETTGTTNQQPDNTQKKCPFTNAFLPH